MKTPPMGIAPLFLSILHFRGFLAENIRNICFLSVFVKVSLVGIAGEILPDVLVYQSL